MVGYIMISRSRERLNHVKRVYGLGVMTILVRDAQKRSSVRNMNFEVIIRLDQR